MPNNPRRAAVQEALGNRYALGCERPRGGISRLLVAAETARGRPVGSKVLAPELSATLSAERVKRELTLAARLQHPHLVPLPSAGQAGAYLYDTRPFVDGKSLRDCMQHERPMPFVDISRIAQEVAGALAYAHAEGGGAPRPPTRERAVLSRAGGGA